MASERMTVALDSGNQEDEHSCFSDTTYQDFVFNAKGISNVYFGDYAGYQGKGFDELLAQMNPDLNQKITAALTTTEESASQIDQPFDQVLASAQGSTCAHAQQHAAHADFSPRECRIFMQTGAALVALSRRFMSV